MTITRLGAQGDGIAETAEGPRFVPFALPGERVRLGAAEMPEVLPPASPERQAPICRHFGACGGCVAQHMSARLYGDWKRGIVVEAFRQRGLAPEVAPLVRVALGSRRRAVLTAQRRGGEIVLGYHRRRSGELLDLGECPVLVPEISAQLAALRAVAGALAEPELRLTVVASSVGLDIAVEGGGRCDGKAAASIGRLAAEHRIARISVSGETLIERAKPVLPIAGVDLVPPAGVFVQAVADAEHAMAGLVTAAAGKARRVVDLFAGVGTFTFPLARRARVLAVDGEAEALAALSAAARGASGLKPIETKQRDLYREPLAALELKEFDAAVLDPPRAGARAQCEALARSAVPVVMYVSCDPATLARDVRTLVGAGYRLEAVTPIDQFLFSAHVEVVAVLRRDR
ncbi:MAG: class I SAM-dependent RNA methyltransferase [Hyphomicrobiaceae bacterium]|nr:MAG: class I SAM-dependent RNA methyltransferase [Hyphomicrobiaceae bacterium]